MCICVGVYVMSVYCVGVCSECVYVMCVLWVCSVFVFSVCGVCGERVGVCSVC